MPEDQRRLDAPPRPVGRLLRPPARGRVLQQRPDFAAGLDPPGPARADCAQGLAQLVAVTDDGKAGGLAGPGDRAVFALMRSAADVILLLDPDVALRPCCVLVITPQGLKAHGFFGFHGNRRWVTPHRTPGRNQDIESSISISVQ